MPQKYFIQTFGCAQNVSDSERIASYLSSQGMMAAEDLEEADYLVINTCMVRESAENRVYGLINNISNIKNLPIKESGFRHFVGKKSKIQSKNKKDKKHKIILTGCMVGMAVRDKTGKFLK